jgi:hypothetical protein
MNSIGIAFATVCVLLMLTLPRRWAILPLILSAAYMTHGQALEIAGANFTMLRIVVAVGFLRVLLRREHIAGGFVALDRWVLCWALLLAGTSAFHDYGAFQFRSGMVWTELGSYFLFRIFVQDIDDARRTMQTVTATLVPLAVIMLTEKSTASNLFAALGYVDAISPVRDGQVRATGPFAHPILAGTVGAGCFGMGLALWGGARYRALIGCTAGGAMVYASASSGPILMLAFILLGVACWVMRDHMSFIRWMALAVILALAAVMKAPFYFLMARIDIMGGSQSWFRAQLIHSAIEHLSEWWLVGTDYTRHWMATGIGANDRHTDMTNHFLSMGVMGGLPLLIVFVLVCRAAFRDVGRSLQTPYMNAQHRFFVWALGAVLFGFVMNFFAITLFDQSAMFFWMLVAAIASIASQAERASETARSKSGSAAKPGYLALQ